MNPEKYTVKYTGRFKKDYKLAVKRGYNIVLLQSVIRDLAADVSLDPKYRDHDLSGNYVGHRECHIQPDWLLIYYKDEDILVLTLTRTGTHGDLFGA